MAMSAVPEGAVNVHGHVHNNEPLRAGPYVNICVEHTEYRPLPLDAVRRLARARLDDPRPRAATTAEEIRDLKPGWAVKPSCGFRAGARDAGASGHDHDVRHD